MERQLGPNCKSTMAEDVNDRGIKFYYDNEVSNVFEGKGMTKIPCRFTLKKREGL